MAEEQIVIEVVVDNSAARKNITAQTSDIVSLEREIKNLQQSQKELSSVNKANSKEYKANAELIALNKSELQSANASRKASIKAISTENSSINALRASLSKNTAARNALNVSTKKGQAEFKRLTKDMKSQSDQLKKLEGDAGDFRRNVGDYKQAFTEASGGIKVFGTDLGSVFNLIKGNPIVLLISAISGLIAIFAKSQTGIEFFRKASAALNATFGLLVDSVEALAIGMSEAFTNPQKALDDLTNTIKDGIAYYFNEFIPNAIQKVVDGFGLLGKAASLVFEGEFAAAAEVGAEAVFKLGDGLTDLNPVTALVKTGIEATTDVVKDLSIEINRATTTAFGLESAMIANEKAIANQQVTVAQSIKTQKELNLLIEDQTASISDRIDAGQKFAQVEANQINESIRLQKEKIRLLKAQNDITNSTEEDLQKVRDAEIELANLQAASLERQVTNQNKLNTVRVQSESAKEKATNEELERLKKLSDADFNLALAKKEQDATEIEDALLKSEALIEIDNIKTQKLLENDQLLQSEKELILFESEVRQNEIKAETAEEIDELDEEEKANKKKRAQQTANDTVAIAGAALSLAADLAGENAEAQKAIAITQATINTAQGVSAALGSSPPPVNFVLAGLTGALGAVQIAKIAGAKFADGGLTEGGMFQGASHANGGIKFSAGGRIHEAEGGEAIISKKATAMFKPQLSAMNVAGGGKKFAVGGTVPNAASLAGSSTSGIDSNVASETSIAKQLSQNAPQVAVTDINRTQSSVSVKESRATI